MFDSFLKRYFSDLDTFMREIVNRADVPGFGVMLRYAMGWVTEDDTPYLKSSGKRIRPMLLFLCCEVSGGNWRTALPAAAAVELLHNFSLIHDDIQDNSVIRHGRPAVWKLWGIANAINAGDALFGLSYKALEKLQEHPLKPETVLRIWAIFNDTVLELTRGQHLDMRFEQQAQVSVEDYLSMIAGKSATLVATCAQIGALIGTQDEKLAQIYADFGLNMGLAFQIRDDILGIWGDPNITGKSAATDILSRKKSLPVLYGLAQSEQLTQIYQRETFSEPEAAEIVKILNALNAQTYAQEVEALYYRRAIDAMELANPQSAMLDSLRRFLDALFQRSY